MPHRRTRVARRFSDRVSSHSSSGEGPGTPAKRAFALLGEACFRLRVRNRMPSGSGAPALYFQFGPSREDFFKGKRSCDSRIPAAGLIERYALSASARGAIPLNARTTKAQPLRRSREPITTATWLAIQPCETAACQRLFPSMNCSHLKIASSYSSGYGLPCKGRRKPRSQLQGRLKWRTFARYRHPRGEVVRAEQPRPHLRLLNGRVPLTGARVSRRSPPASPDTIYEFNSLSFLPTAPGPKLI